MGEIGDYQGLAAELETDIENLDKEIERLKHENKMIQLTCDRILAEHGVTKIEIEQLKKENEWLIENLVGTWQQDRPDTEDDELRAFVLDKMQQELKEK